jgi:hypothetical protein
MDNFGYTNDPLRYRRAVLYRISAIADGWRHRDMYSKDSTACELHFESFTMQIITRKFAVKSLNKYQASVNIWGPDELAILPPDKYNMDDIRAGLTTCYYCKTANVKVQRVGFAGRCCDKCLQKERLRQEFPGWTS